MQTITKVKTRGRSLLEDPYLLQGHSFSFAGRAAVVFVRPFRTCVGRYP